MKKLLLILIGVTFFAYESKAQDDRTLMRDRVLFGLKAGINSSNVYATEGEGFTPAAKAGLAAGVFLSIPILDYVGIQPELLISQKGFNATGSIAGNVYELTRTTTYLDIPLLVAVKPISFITLLAGPNFSYLLKEKYAFENASTTIEQEEDFMNDEIRKGTLSFGGGLDINLNHFVLGARAFWDLQKNNGDKDSTTPRYKNTWYQATLGYRFY